MAIPVLKRLQNVLAHYGLEPQSNIEICSTSGINEVFFVTTERGKIALKHHIQNNNLLRLKQEVAFSLNLTQNGSPCPPVLANQNGQLITEHRSSELYIASEYVEGHYFPKGESLKELHIINAAQALARFHQTSKLKATLLHSPLLPGYDLSGLTNRLMTYRCELHTLEKSHHCAAAMLSLMHHAMPRAMGLSRLLPDSLLVACEKVIIHGDLKSSNLLVDEQGEIKAFLDLDDAREDLRIYDIFQLALYCVDQGYGSKTGSRTESWQASLPLILDAYGEIEELNRSEIKAFPALVEIYFLHRLGDERLDVTARHSDAEVLKLQRALTALEEDTQALTELTQKLISKAYA